MKDAGRKAPRLIAWVPLGLAVAWSLGAILLGGGGPGAVGLVRWGLAAAFLVGAALAVRKLRGWSAVAAVGAQCLLVAAWFATIAPSNDRDWSPDQARLPWTEVTGPLVTIHDVRDFRYRGPDDWDEGWYDATYDTRELIGADLFVVHFSDNEAIGHTMLSFRFAGGRTVTFSVEVRKERGEDYGILRGLYRQFEMMYVVGDERDLVELRTNHRRSVVYLHPLRPAPERQVAMFLDMCRRLDELRERPAFYDTLFRNCTTSIVSHWEQVTGESLPLDHRWVLAGGADELAFELGLLDTDVGFEETRRANLIGEEALARPEGEDYSAWIRR